MTDKSKILIVDDELGPRESLRMILRDHYEVTVLSNGLQALDLLDEHEFDLAIIDIRMPEINGIELLGKIKEKAPATEVVMITAYASLDTATRALRLGALDYLIKPFDHQAVLDVVEKGLNRREESRSIKDRIKELQLVNKTLEDKIEQTYNDIQEHYDETINSLVAAVDAKDSYTKGHQERVAHLVCLIGEFLSIKEEERAVFYHAATLHDIGKIGVNEEILRKPGTLTDEEFAVIKKHPIIGAEILSPVKFLNAAVPLVLHHHEHYDGCGYPKGLSGCNIPLGARVISVADSIDAMLWDRPYALQKTVNEVKEELQRVSGSHFDPELVELVLENDLVSSYKKKLNRCYQK